MLQKRHILTISILNVFLGLMVILQIHGQSLWQAIQPVALASPPFQQQLQKVLKDSWTFYKGHFLQDGSHVVSNNYGGTITEGQSYALLKSLWMNEPETFRRVWTWTKAHMQRPQDHLLGWRWGTRKDGTQGLLEMDNATDADQDIAYALLLAGEKWKNPGYIQDAKAIINDIWRLNVQAIDGRLYLTPGTWEGFRWEYLTLDPSYFAPYVYRKFAQYDADHAQGWNQLANDIYDTLEDCSNLTAQKLPPNWCAVKWHDDGTGSRIMFSDRQGQGSRHFGYDAFRVYWRMAMDAKDVAKLSPSPGRERAKEFLRKHTALLKYWQQHQLMPEGFSETGQPLSNGNSGFTMGPLLVTQAFQKPTQTGVFYQKTLGHYYNSEGYWFNDYNDYLHSVIWLHLYSLSLQ